MRLAFGIVSLFPWGGLQRDCLRIASAAKNAGHEVTIFTSRIRAAASADVRVEILPVRSFTNHGRNREFGKALQRATAARFDRVVGFDKLEGLDVLYCGDVCFAERKLGFLLHHSPRVRGMLKLEAACFSVDSRTRILALAEPQIDAYRRAWKTPAERFELLPPPIDPRRRHPEYRSDGTRDRMRAELGVAAGDLIILSIGAPIWRKGFDRAVEAMSRSLHWKLWVCGVGPETREGASLQRLSSNLGISERVKLLGPREDVEELLAAADLFVHLARIEATGTVILEAMINGVPTIASGNCGFAPHVTRADAGIVLKEPFEYPELTDALEIAADPVQRARWSANAVAYGADPALYSGVDHALKAILANA